MGGSRVDNLAAKIEALRKKRAHQAAILGRLEATGENQISLIYPDCRSISASGKIIVGYNARVAVDAKNKLTRPSADRSPNIDGSGGFAGELVSQGDSEAEYVSV